MRGYAAAHRLHLRAVSHVLKYQVGSGCPQIKVRHFWLLDAHQTAGCQCRKRALACHLGLTCILPACKRGVVVVVGCLLLGLLLHLTRVGVHRRQPLPQGREVLAHRDEGGLVGQQRQVRYGQQRCRPFPKKHLVWSVACGTADGAIYGGLQPRQQSLPVGVPARCHGPFEARLHRPDHSLRTPVGPRRHRARSNVLDVQSPQQCIEEALKLLASVCANLLGAPVNREHPLKERGAH